MSAIPIKIIANDTLRSPHDHEMDEYLIRSKRDEKKNYWILIQKKEMDVLMLCHWACKIVLSFQSERI